MAHVSRKSFVGLLAALAALTMLTACGEARTETPAPPPVFQSTETWPDGPDARPWTHLNFRNNPDDFQFAIIGDRSGGMRQGVFEAVLGKVNALQPEFVMSIGDYMEGYTFEPDKLAAEWAEVDGFMQKLESPLFLVVGNHDIFDTTSEALWRKHAGLPRYHFVYKNVLFIALNTEDGRYATPEERVELNKALEVMARDPKAVGAFMQSNPVIVKYLHDNDGGRIGDEQTKWVLGLLDRYKDVRWTFFFMHRPVWREKIANVERIEAALGTRGYTMIGGHTHHYAIETRHGRDYIEVGTAGGGWSLDGKPGEMDAVVWVTMRDGGPVITNLVATGILPKDAVPAIVPGAELCGDAYALPCLYPRSP
ncbi:metallophosphoesterase [Emcibacter sp. SYSU 3D8]|uniref:metallophosphoesterase family protein n=1 Tax=Emcibacter sp. SYSU 3D8 TaxID=3133969 RepID=UPI0031FF0B75